MKLEPRKVEISGLPALALELLAIAKSVPNEGATIIALHGDLGAGKTTFVQALGKALGVTEQITSPTFTIMKGYETTDADFEHLIHMDAYQLEDISELAPLRFSEILATPKTLFCIEWAERIKEALPSRVINLWLSTVDENTRSAHITLE